MHAYLFRPPSLAVMGPPAARRRDSTFIAHVYRPTNCSWRRGQILLRSYQNIALRHILFLFLLAVDLQLLHQPLHALRIVQQHVVHTPAHLPAGTRYARPREAGGLERNQSAQPQRIYVDRLPSFRSVDHHQSIGATNKRRVNLHMYVTPTPCPLRILIAPPPPTQPARHPGSVRAASAYWSSLRNGNCDPPQDVKIRVCYINSQLQLQQVRVS